MKSASAFSLFFTGVTLCLSSLASAQNGGQNVTPETAPPVLVPIAPAKRRLTAIKIRNVPSAYLAWQLDPAHNPPPVGVQLAQLKRDGTPDAQRLDLMAQWIQIDDETLARALPAWNALGASNWTRIATYKERVALETLNALDVIAPVTQRIFARDKQPSFLSYLPLRPIVESVAPMQPPAPAPAIKSQPKMDSLFADPPYIPNYAEMMPMLPYMAPMPNMGSAPPLSSMTPDVLSELNVNPYLRLNPGGIDEMQGAKFGLTPAINADKTIALTLHRLSAFPGADATIQMGENETAIFSLPDVTSPAPTKIRRTFLLVTPRLMPPAPTDLPTP